MNKKLLLAIGIGGMLGTVGRYMVSVIFQVNILFPYATLTVNLVGCFFLSFLLMIQHLKKTLSPETSTAIGTGVIGSFTTFSTFAYETVELWDVNVSLAVLYVLISIFGGLFCCYTGVWFANKWVKK